MGSAVPKQYLPLAGRTVIEHTLERISGAPYLAGIVIALAPDDEYWPRLQLNYPVPIYYVQGGAERVDSVLAGLNYLSELAAPDDWVLVHDAARPCLRVTDLEHLVSQLETHPVGGLLALPIADTVKRTTENGRVIATLARVNLWRALTPQMFRFDQLRAALTDALARGDVPTDESAAIEATGLQPQIVIGHADNIKITHAGDLALAELFLRAQAFGQ